MNLQLFLVFLFSCPSVHVHPDLSTQPFTPSGLMCELLSHPELSLITNPAPEFSWIVNSDKPGDFQAAYKIMVASSPELLKNETPDMWNTGNVSSGQSLNIRYAGKPLSSNSAYWWKVKTLNKSGGESAWSIFQKFNTSDLDAARKWPGESKWARLKDAKGDNFWAFENRHPIIYHSVQPDKQVVRKNGTHFYDFKKSAFSTLELNLTWSPKKEMEKQLVLEINIGEKAVADSIDQKPGGGIIFRTYQLTIKPGNHLYSLEIPRFVAKYPHSQVMPLEMPEVIPFRYCELKCNNENIQVNKITQKALYCLFNDQASNFLSSDNRLNSIYGLCKYSTIANTFNGDYANSERERMMYEADCYIQQMGHYAIDREFAIARYSLENLIYHATWPTEWISHSIFMAWADYWYTGNTKVIRTYYNDLKAKTMTALETENGLISTRTGLQTKDFLKSIHFNGKELRDIVDWPHGGMGIGSGGETDNYDFRDFNTVVNAFYFQSLVYMAEMSGAIGKQPDSDLLNKKANAVKIAFNQYFLDKTNGIYVDGIGSSHASLHANLYALCFGLVPEKYKSSVIDYIKSKGMACGVYSSNYLLEALFNYGQPDYAFSLLTSDSDRSWLNMIRVGATMTTEAWDNKYKSNNGWSHAWSASPVHIIPRKIMGIEPLEPGFRKIRIKPQPASLEYAEIKYPTIRGDVLMSFKNRPKQSFTMNLTIPTNTTADVYLPSWSKTHKVTMNGNVVKYRYTGGFIIIEGVGPGNSTFEITT
jgi:alpha-L-rhamnosidase